MARTKPIFAKTISPLWMCPALFLLALAIRLPYLGTYLTIDEVKWIEGAGQFLPALTHGKLAQTYWHFFPGITITWGEALILWLRWLFSGQADLLAYVAAQLANLPSLVGWMRLSGVVITSMGAASVYPLARRLVGAPAALLSAALLAVAPFFVAHSRIVNGDAGTAMFMFLTILAFAQLWRGASLRWAAIAGVLAGLALLTKLPSPIIGPWIALLAIIGWRRTGNWRFWLKALVIFGAVSLLTFVALFPAMWVNPLETLRQLYADSFNVGELGAGHDTFFLGQISDDPGWGFYPLAIAFRLTPVTVVGLVAVIFWLWRGQAHRKELPVALSVVLSLVGYVVFVYLFANLSPKKLDRYLMPVIPPLLMLASIGWVWLLQLAARRFNHYRIVSVGGGIVILLIAWFTVSNYPYVLTYYNPLLGGFANAGRLVPVGWGEGLEQAARWINAQPNSADALVSSWYSDNVTPYLQTGTSSFSSSGKGQLSADYVIFYRNQLQRQKPNQAVINYFTDQEPLFTVGHRGTDYVWVYKAPGMQTEVSGSNKIEGRATMLGYSWVDAQPPHKANDTVDLTIFFHTLGDLPANEAFDVALMAADGALWGRWDAPVLVAWSPDAIINWRGTLTLPEDIPSGEYRLVVRLLDTNINSEVTRFPLEDEFVILGD